MSQQPTPTGTESAPPPIDKLPGGLNAGIESVLMVIDEPISATRLAEVFEVGEERVTAALILSLIHI